MEVNCWIGIWLLFAHDYRNGKYVIATYLLKYLFSATVVSITLAFMGRITHL